MAWILGKRLTVLVLVATIIAAVAATSIPTSSGSSDQTAADVAKKKRKKKKKKRKKSGFAPSFIAGKWTGTHTNTTFNTQGAIRADVASLDSGKQLRVTLSFGGTVFGCSNPAPDIITLNKGSGVNQWSSSGFKIKQTTNTFGGDIDANYNFKDKSFKATGSSNKCIPAGVSYTATGTLNAKAFEATVNIQGQGFTAVSKLSATR